jgi:hypothetical protein
LFGRTALLIVVSACIIWPATALGQTNPPPGKYFLVLGDSLAYGLTAPDIPADPTCQSATAPGYVCIAYGYLKQVAPGLQLQNMGVPEMDSCILVSGFGAGSPCKTRPPGGDVASPLAGAVLFLSQHPGQVGPIMVNVGGADLVPLLPAAVSDPAGTAAKLPALFRAIQTNLDVALSALRAAAGDNTEIILITQYNPLGGIASPPLPPGLPDIAAGAIHGLNQLELAVGAKYNVIVADVAAAFDAHPGGAALLTFVPPSLASGDPTKIDIYPTIDGYRLYGQTVLKASGYQAPAVITAQLSKKKQTRGKQVALHGVAVSGSTIRITVTLPHAKASVKTVSADNGGAYTLTFSVGKHAGNAAVKACESDQIAGKTACSKKLSIAVT